MKLHSFANTRGVFSIAALAIVAVCYWYYQSNDSRLENSLINMQSCERLAAEINRVRQVPQRARLTSQSVDDQGAAVEKAAAEAHLGRDRVLRIDPQSAKRIVKSDYLEQATEVEFLAISLKQLVDFVFNLTRVEAELAISTIRLRLPHDSDPSGQELWLADVVLTQRIYAPTTPRKE
jgi:hypothetical protein